MTESHFLTHVFQTKDFSSEELATIIPQFKRTTFSKNDYLLKGGQIENYYWFIENGFVRSYVVDTEGNDITTNLCASGDIVIDWTSFFLRSPTREHIQALTDCVCWQLDFDTFQQLFHSIQSFREQGRTTLVNSYFSLKKQSVSMIADQAKERYAKLIKEKPHIIQNISLKHIATYLGITDTSLSRIRKEISDE
ncbi:Crp/Fnr family transcriptional regulator [Reichenbachiella agarivorans]|uniref:Crp/Fnr family transcriptional regulator n=1 Tax=Reichenbachiella agarivorans TaxID=2979464 RepID=A0ABY6CMW5_9BACT|nr:Crp/Fnr family transcriptional regulator [Reichenbachiella agarivorans]UXP31841.1 Crp/Fnr family transcriptional regulator [Reichenbachiella agarivorans]